MVGAQPRRIKETFFLVLSFFLSLRVEFLLKTNSGYPKEKGANLLALATPGNPLRYNTPPSAPPVSALTHSRGPGARQAGGLWPRSRRASQESDQSFHVLFFAVFHSFCGSCGCSGQLSGIFEIGRLPLDFFEIRHNCPIVVRFQFFWFFRFFRKKQINSSA